MKKTLFLFSLFLLLCSNTFIELQSKKPYGSTKVSISELTVIDSVVLKGIDRFIFNAPCKVGDSYKYFTLHGRKLSSDTYTSFYFCVYEKIEIPGGETPIGFFEYRGSTFFVFDYCPNEIFRSSQTKKDFFAYLGVYGTDPGGIWELLLEDGEIQLQYISCAR